MENDNDIIEQVCADLCGHDLTPPPRGAWVIYARRIREVYNNVRRKWDAAIADQRSINKKLTDEIEKLKAALKTCVDYVKCEYGCGSECDAACEEIESGCKLREWTIEFGLETLDRKGTENGK